MHHGHVPPYNAYATPAVRLLLFPTYQPGAALRLGRLSPANAGLHLMRCLVNARNLPDHGLADVTRLVQRVPAYTLTYSSLTSVASQVAALLDERCASPSPA